MKSLRQFNIGRTGAEMSARPGPTPGEVRVGRVDFVGHPTQTRLPNSV
jgi:hypothetical protein